MKNKKFRVFKTLQNLGITPDRLTVSLWKLISSSFGPTEQLSINNGGRFPLTKALKLRSKVRERKKIKFALVLLWKRE